MCADHRCAPLAQMSDRAPRHMDIDTDSDSDDAPMGVAPMGVAFLTSDECTQLARRAVIAQDPSAVADLTTQVEIGNVAAGFARSFVRGEQLAQDTHDRMIASGANAEDAEAVRQAELATALSAAQLEANAVLNVTQYREDGYRNDDGGLQPLLPYQMVSADRIAAARAAMEKQAAEAAAKPTDVIEAIYKAMAAEEAEARGEADSAAGPSLFADFKMDQNMSWCDEMEEE